jgi:hypothetical protein
MMFTVEEAVNLLDLTLPRARALVRLCERTLSPDNFASVKKQFSRWHNWPGFPEKVLCAANELLRGYGVEAIYFPNDSSQVVAEYVNMGDAYSITLFYDHESKDFLIDCWGDYVEGMEEEEDEEEVVDLVAVDGKWVNLGAVVEEEVDDEVELLVDGKWVNLEDTERFLRDWVNGNFWLVMYDTNRRDSRGQSYIGYRFYHGTELIFSGEDFSGSPMHADDSDATVASLLHFLSLRPGDTDQEYFESYTQRQLEWCQEFGEELGYLAHELEECGKNPD